MAAKGRLTLRPFSPGPGRGGPDLTALMGGAGVSRWGSHPQGLSGGTGTRPWVLVALLLFGLPVDEDSLGTGVGQRGMLDSWETVGGFIHVFPFQITTQRELSREQIS